MLYKCLECEHKISADAWRCPNCGKEDAGALAKHVHDHLERDRLDPGWEEREQKAKAALKKKERNYLYMSIGFASIFSFLLLAFAFRSCSH